MFKKKLFQKNSYDVNQFINKQIKIIYLKDNKEVKTYIFNKKKGGHYEYQYDISTKELYNDNNSEEEEMIGLASGGADILDILLKQDDKKEHIVKETINVYPFDNILDLKYKIQLLTGIEWFKLSLFWDLNNSSYDIVINKTKYKINFSDLTRDLSLNNIKNEIKIKAYDEFLTLKNINQYTFYVRNIDDYIDRTKLLNDRNEVEIFYFSFIIKFFPQFTYELFYDYLYIYKDFKIKYNSLFILPNFKNDEIIVNKFLRNYKDKDNEHFYKYIEINFNDIVRQYIKLRNMFDIFHINENFNSKKEDEYDIVFMYMKLGNEIYKKKHKKEVEIKEYKSIESIVHINNIVFYIKNDYSNTPIFLTITEYSSFQVKLNIDNINTNYDTAFKYLQKKINPIINKINTFKEILLLTSLIDDLQYDNINLITSKSTIFNIHSLQINYQNFNIIYDELLKYKDIFLNVSKNNDYGQDVIVFNLKKGISSYNKEYFSILHPNVKNYYSKFSVVKDMEGWNSSYKGIFIKFLKTPNNLQIHYLAVNELDISFITFLMNSFLDNIKFITEKRVINLNTDSKIKKLNKLKLIDPDLYSFRQSKNSKNKYSKMCQKPFHPLVYTEDEYKYLTEELKKKIIPYQNITTNNKVYYYCNNKDAPYLGFITDEHPKDFCIPCCRVKPQEEKENHNQCLTNYKTTKIQKESEQHIKYILQHIEDNRYSYLPTNLHIFFNKYVKNITKKNYYLFGNKNFSDIFSDKSKEIFENFNVIHILKINIIIIDKNADLIFDYIFNYDDYIILYKDERNKYIPRYFPIIEFDQNEQKKYFKKDDKIINIITDIINKNYEEDNLISNKWSLAYVKKNYKIKKILINNKNLIYAVLIEYGSKKQCLYPINYYYNNTNYETFDILNKNTLKEITEENTIYFLKTIKLINEIKYYYVDNKDNYFALKLLNNKIFYFNTTKEKTLMDKFDKIIHYPLYEISEKILKNEITYNIEPLKYDIYYIYYKNLYKLILQEITYYLLSKKNIEKRNILNKGFTTYLKKPDLFYKFIKSNFEDKNDNNKILTLYNQLNKMSSLSKNEINILLNKISFDFDNDEKNSYINNPSYKLINDLLDNVCSFVGTKELSKTINKEILSNILTPCYLQKSNYCNRNKLLVPQEERNYFIQLIINDLNNPIKKHIIFSIKIIIEDQYMFDCKHYEEIIIT
jgi:hypothetical protein